jgi:hypothetical protein
MYELPLGARLIIAGLAEKGYSGGVLRRFEAAF